MYKKLKSLLADDLVFTSLLLCCVALAAFMLGRLSVESAGVAASHSAPAVHQTALLREPADGPGLTSAVTSRAASPTTKILTGSIVASKSGTKYHLTTCPGAKQIKEENKIYFATTAEAEALGYSPAANCKF